MADGWGLEPWGLGPWGLGPATPGMFSVESTFATSERTLRVTFTDPALTGSALKPGSALNLAVWSLVTDETLPVNPIVLSVREVPGSGARQFELYTLRKLPRYPTELEVACPTVLSASGGALVGASSFDLHGAAQARQTRTENRSTPSDLQSAQLPGEALAAVLKTTAAGDYEVESGDALLRKMILRRLTTEPGEFSFLPASFGLRLKAKQTIRGGGGLNDLREFIEAQCLLEPDVQAAKAVLSYKPAQGLLVVDLKVRRATTGGEVDAGFSLPTND